MNQSQVNQFGITNGNVSDQDYDDLAAKRKEFMKYKTLYQVRPYVYEILRALQPFFEMIALSNMSNYELEQIIDHMEAILNKPIIEMINR